MDQVQILFGRLDSALGLLLEAMQHVQSTGELHGVHGPEGIPPKVFHHLQHAGRPKPGQWLDVRVLATTLGHIKGMAEDVFDVVRHGIQITFCRADPFERLPSLLRHGEIMPVLT